MSHIARATDGIDHDKLLRAGASDVSMVSFCSLCALLDLKFRRISTAC